MKVSEVSECAMKFCDEQTSCESCAIGEKLKLKGVVDIDEICPLQDMVNVIWYEEKQ